MRLSARVTALSLSVILGLSLAPIAATQAAVPDNPTQPETINLQNDTVQPPARMRVKGTATPSEVVTPATPVTHTIDISVATVSGADAGDPVVSVPTQAQAAAFIAKLNTYWHRESNNAITIVLGDYETRTITSACQVSSDSTVDTSQQVFNAAKAEAFDGAYSSSWIAGRHLLTLTTQQCAGGLATIGGNTAGGLILSGAGISDALGLPVSLHEFGHNLGLHHANAAICANSTYDASTADLGFPVTTAHPTASTACVTEEYGDYLDIMGYTFEGSTPHLSVPQKLKLGFLTDVTTIADGSAQSTTSLKALGGTGVRALAVEGNNETYFLEYRTPDTSDINSYDFYTYANDAPQDCATTDVYQRCDSTMTGAGGVRILRRVAMDPTYDGTDVLAVGPIVAFPGALKRDTHLDACETFTNYDSDFTVAIGSVNPTTGADVRIAYGAAPAAFTTTTAVAISAPTTKYNNAAVTATATVSPAGSGTVQFKDNGVNVGTPIATKSGAASLALSNKLAAGTHAITAVFTSDNTAVCTNSSGSANVEARSGSRLSVTARALADENGDSAGLRATATVAIDDGSAATGTVLFAEGGTSLGAVAVANGVATLDVTSVKYGSHQVTATFVPTNSTNFDGASNLAFVDLGSAPVVVVPEPEPAPIVKAATSVTFKFTATKVKKTKKAIITVTVKGGKPTGKITVYDKTKKLTTFTLKASAKGKAKITLPKITKVGKHSITVKYSGDTDFKPSTSKKVNLTIIK